MSSRSVRFAELVEENVLEIGAGRPRSEGAHLPVLRVADVLDGHVQSTIKPDGFTAHHADAGPKASRPGDIVLTTKGTVGRVAIMPSDGPTYAYSPQLCYFRPLDGYSLAPRYLYYWFKSAEFWSQADAVKAQTDMADFISLQDVHSLTMRLPPIDEQKAIAEVLGALDDKIAANTAATRLADELVRAKYEALEGDLVPLGSIAASVRDQVDPKTAGPETPYVGLEHVPRRLMWLSDFESAAKVSSAKASFRAGDVLFGKLRPYFHKVVSAPFSGIASTDILIVRAMRSELRGLVLAAASSDAAISATTASSEGTRMPRTKWADLAAVEMPWPGNEEARRFSDQVSDLANWAAAMAKESRDLATVRDELLPLLMSGKVRVKDAEKPVEGVL